MFKVCIIGPDGSGKTSLIPAIAANIKGLSVDIIRTTAVVPGDELTYEWRKDLLSEDTTPFRRFMCAFGLYTTNFNNYVLKTLRNPPDVLIIERGYSSMITYNRVEKWSLKQQQGLIPHVDFPVYVNAPFDQLTARLSRRHSTDFQDNNLEYRQKVWQQGVDDYYDLVNARNDQWLVADNSDGQFENVADEIAFNIVNAYRKKNP